jgi:hypothetical protein
VSPGESRDKAVAALARVLGLSPEDAAELTDRLTTCAAAEANARVAEDLVAGLHAAVDRHSQGLLSMLDRARRELGGEHG